MPQPGPAIRPIGLFCCAWPAHAHTHWVIPNSGVVIYTAGSIIGLQCMQTYIVDAY
ncbi:hypothetical protein B0O99DRAFT_499789 [Bisporella sp. PMI_857]|nr:hypothetical protein B0O99DRAFT_499789 [Bisporella sp. PMI_857]